MWTRQGFNRLIARIGLTNADAARELSVSRERVRQFRLPPFRKQIPEKYWEVLDKLNQRPTLRRWTPEMMHELRMIMDWTQAEAEAATGIDSTHWSVMERGVAPISDAVCLKLEPFYRKKRAKELALELKKS